MGPYAIGALLTDDRSPGGAFPGVDPVSDERAFFGIFRLSRDIETQSSVGVIYTDREFAKSSNRVAGVDGRLKLNQNWTAAFQAATSATTFLDGASLNGPAYEATLNRSGRQFNYDLTYQDRSPEFRTAVGFDPRPDIRSLHQLAGYRFRPEGERFLSWGPDFLVQPCYRPQGHRTRAHFRPSDSLGMEASNETWRLLPQYRRNPQTARFSEFDDQRKLRANEEGPDVLDGLHPASQLRRPFRLGNRD